MARIQPRKNSDMDWEEAWYSKAHPKTVHALCLSDAIENLYSKLFTTHNEWEYAADDAAVTIARIYGADEDYLLWLLDGRRGP